MPGRKSSGVQYLSLHQLHQGKLLVRSEIGCLKSEEWPDEVGMVGAGAVLKMFVVSPEFSWPDYSQEFPCKGFAAFFSIFEITRRVANRTKGASQSLVDSLNSEETQMQLLRRHFPRTVHGVTLVSGGVIAGLSYEIISRPFDMARRFVLEDRLLPTQKQRSVAMTVINRIKQDGILTFLKRYSSGNTASSAAASSGSGSVGNRWLYGTLRTLARVGPWGVGFLVWEAFGPGLS